MKDQLVIDAQASEVLEGAMQKPLIGLVNKITQMNMQHSLEEKQLPAAGEEEEPYKVSDEDMEPR
eukprot:5649840-Pyramimonas_sp.AAC.1